MRPLPVVVPRVLGEDAVQVPLTEDQHPIGDLGADGQDEAFGEAVHPRTPRRDLDHLDTDIGQHRVERSCELSRSVPDEEPEPPDVLAEYSAHYNTQRPHRAQQLRPPRPEQAVPDLGHERVRRRPILGGLINEYEPAA